MRTQLRLSKFIGLSLIAFAASVAHGQSSTLRVDDSAPAGGDGTTWALAFRHLQDALAAARNNPGIHEIRVGQGTYRPDRGAGMTVGDRTAAFDMVNGVALRGGYAGFGAANPNLRDIIAFTTTLTGDLSNNDGPGFANYDDNSYRIVRAANLDPATTLSGLTISGSQTELATPLLGGGVFCDGGGLTIEDCRLVANTAFLCAGVAASAVDVRVRRCTFDRNMARQSGGGIAAQATTNGAAALLIEDCSFIDNVTQFEDGGAIHAGSNPATVRRSTFLRNHADDGGAISGQMFVEDSQFTDNLGNNGGAASGGGVFRGCVFRGNSANFTGGAYANISNDPALHARFIDCHFTGNSTQTQSGGAANGGIAFVNCSFMGNRSGVSFGGPDSPGGAIHARLNADIVNCVFSGNRSEGAGGALSVLVAANVNLSCSTFAGNTSVLAGSAVRGPATIANCIFAAHAGTPLANVGTVRYWCVTRSIAGAGNQSANPRLMNPLGVDGLAGTDDDDLRLGADSPCIDAGDTTALPADVFDLDGDGDSAERLPLDRRGNRRVLETPAVFDTGIAGNAQAVVDMGAHEFRRSADTYPSIGDGSVDVDDLAALMLQWGPCPPSGACTSDINRDGEVEVNDLIELILQWG